jgi:hypothetical protein
MLLNVLHNVHCSGLQLPWPKTILAAILLPRRRDHIHIQRLRSDRWLFPLINHSCSFYICNYCIALNCWMTLYIQTSCRQIASVPLFPKCKLRTHTHAPATKLAGMWHLTLYQFIALFSTYTVGPWLTRCGLRRTSVTETLVNGDKGSIQEMGSSCRLPKIVFLGGMAHSQRLANWKEASLKTYETRLPTFKPEINNQGYWMHSNTLEKKF